MSEEIIEEHHGIIQPARVKETIEYEQFVELLSTGIYTIRTVPSLQLVGRNIVEDASFDPKGVYGQPLGVPLSPNTSFMLRHVGGPRGDSYHITVGRDRGRVIAIEGRVAAVLNSVGDVLSTGGSRVGGMVVPDVWEVDPHDELPVNQRWAVRRQPQHGDDVYTYISSVFLL